MTKISLLIFFISAFKLSFGQVDTTHVNGIILRIKEIKVTEYCPTTTIKNKTYEFQVGETYNRTVLANGWFINSSDSCYRSTWIQKMIDEKFYLGSEGVKKFKKGKPYSGRVREDDGEYKIIGRCKKGVPYGKFVILNADNELIWKGVINKMGSE